MQITWVVFSLSATIVYTVIVRYAADSRDDLDWQRLAPGEAAADRPLPPR